MKKMMCLLLALITMLSMTACGEKTSNRLEEIKKRGYIEVATEPYFAPNEFIDPSKEGDDKYLGSDIMLMKAIAEEIGVELKIVPLEFTAVLTGITTGKYDMAISAIAYSDERAENMNLSNLYWSSGDDDSNGNGFLVRAEDIDKYTTIESLKDAVVAVQSGSVQETLVNEFITECKEIKRFSSTTDGFLAVQENRADVCITQVGMGNLYAEANGNLLAIASYRFPSDADKSGTVVALPKDGTDELMEIVNKVVDQVRSDGTFLKWDDEAKAQAKALGIE